jgi:hypothetical protein
MLAGKSEGRTLRLRLGGSVLLCLAGAGLLYEYIVHDGAYIPLAIMIAGSLLSTLAAIRRAIKARHQRELLRPTSGN